MRDEQEKLLYQILAGKIECNVLGRLYYISSANPILRIKAQNVYQKVYDESRFLGMSTDSDVFQQMIKYGFWTNKNETDFKSMNVIIDDLKVEMYNKYEKFLSKQVEKIRRSLDDIRRKYVELFNRRHSNDYFTCEGQATLEKTRFIIQNSIFNKYNKRVRVKNDWILSKIVELYMANKPSEVDIRHIANSDKWRSIWTCGKIFDVFGVPAVLLTDEQRSLVGWSKLYDNIFEHTNSPAKEVIDDDDLLDGWLIIEQRNREKEKDEAKKGGDNASGGSQTMFIPAESKMDADRIYSKNSPNARLMQQQRLQTVKKHKKVEEKNFLDSKLQMMQQK